MRRAQCAADVVRASWPGGTGVRMNGVSDGQSFVLIKTWLGRVDLWWPRASNFIPYLTFTIYSMEVEQFAVNAINRTSYKHSYVKIFYIPEAETT